MTLREQVEQLRNQLNDFCNHSTDPWPCGECEVNILTTFALAQRRGQTKRDAKIARQPKFQLMAGEAIAVAIEREAEEK